MPSLSTQHKILLSKLFLHLAALIPIFTSYYAAIYDESVTDPVKMIIHFTGEGAFRLLILTACISIFAKYGKAPWLIQTRRLVGLYAFTYSVLHIASFWAFELQFLWSRFIEEIVERPYIWVGLAAFIILFALAITSPNKIRAKMGRKWQSLHYSIYPALLLVSIHFYWSVKATPVEPVMYGGFVLILLGFKWPNIKKWLHLRAKF